MASGIFLGVMNDGYPIGTERKESACVDCPLATECDGSPEKHLALTGQTFTPEQQQAMDDYEKQKTTFAAEGLSENPDEASPLVDDQSKNTEAEPTKPQEQEKQEDFKLPEYDEETAAQINAKKNDELNLRSPDHNFDSSTSIKVVRVNGALDIIGFDGKGILANWDESKVGDGGMSEFEFQRIITDLETQGYSIYEVNTTEGYTGYFLWELTGDGQATSTFYEHVKPEPQDKEPALVDPDLTTPLDQNEVLEDLDEEGIEPSPLVEPSPIKTPIQLFSEVNEQSKVENGISLDVRLEVLPEVSEEPTPVSAAVSPKIFATHPALRILPASLRAVFEHGFSTNPPNSILERPSVEYHPEEVILSQPSTETAPQQAQFANIEKAEVKEIAEDTAETKVARSTNPETTSGLVGIETASISPIYRANTKTETATESQAAASNTITAKPAEKLSPAPAARTAQGITINETPTNNPDNSPPTMKVDQETGETHISLAPIRNKDIPIVSTEFFVERPIETIIETPIENIIENTGEETFVEKVVPLQTTKPEAIPIQSSIKLVESVSVPIEVTESAQAPRTSLEVQRDTLTKELDSARQALRVLSEIRSGENGRNPGNNSSATKITSDETEIDSRITPLQPTSAEQAVALAA